VKPKVAAAPAYDWPDLLAIFGGESRPVVAHLIQAGKLSLEDVEFAEKTLKSLKDEEGA
jgi:BlaI family transcriptional regulator, penicillinase repressor